MSQLSLAFNRFGLGARPDEPAPANPKAWLLGQLKSYDPRPAAIAAAPSRADVAADLADYIAETRGGQGQARRQQPPPATAAPNSGAMAEMDKDERIAGLPDAAKQYIRHQAQDYYLRMVGARTNAALITPTPFVERLVHFWANHFAVSADKLPGDRHGRPARIRGDPPACAGQVRRHAASRSSSIRRCCSISTRRNRSAPIRMLGRARRGARRPQARAQRESRPRDPGAAHARRRQRLHPGRRHRIRPRADRLDGRAACCAARRRALPASTARRAISFRRRRSTSRATRNIARARLCPAGRGAGPGRARRSRAEPAHRAPSRDQARPPFRRRRSAAGAGRAAGRGLSAQRRRPADRLSCADRLPRGLARRQPKFKTPWDWSVSALRAVGTQTVRAVSRRPAFSPSSASRSGGRDRRPAMTISPPSWAGPDALLRRVEAAERIAARTGGPIDARQLGAAAAPRTPQRRHQRRRSPAPKARRRALALAARRARIPEEMSMIDRRSFLGAGAAARSSLAAAPHVAFAQAATDRRFVFIIQRGAADGLGTLGADRRSGLRRCAAPSPRISRPAPSSAISSRCIPTSPRPRSSIRRKRGAVRPRRRLALSRPLAFRRPERARDRRQRRLRAARRLDEPAARPAARRTRPRRSRSRRRCRWCCAAAAKSPPTRPRLCPRRRTTCSTRVGDLYEKDAQLHAPLERGDADAHA